MVAAIVVILFVAPKRLPVLGRALGQTIRGFKRGLKEGPEKGAEERRRGPLKGAFKAIPSSPTVARTPPRKPPGTAPQERAPRKEQSRGGLVRFLRRSPRGRKAVLIGLGLVLIAYLAFAFVDAFFGDSGLRVKATAFLVFVAVGTVLIVTAWIVQRRKGRPLRSPEN